jgi:hypothetical protein
MALERTGQIRDTNHKITKSKIRDQNQQNHKIRDRLFIRKSRKKSQKSGENHENQGHENQGEQKSGTQKSGTGYLFPPL